jgi:FkbM family methyltransferase
LTLASSIYGHVLGILYSRHGLPWRVCDEIVRIDPRVRHLIPHDGEPALFRFLKQTIAPGDIVLDVGAFLGVYAVLSARWAGESGRVIAFEPTASSAAIARQHFDWNDLRAERGRLIEAAVGDRERRDTFYEYSLPYVNSLERAADTDATPTKREVSVVTIDSVCRDLRIVPSVIRMDVQGAEIHALLGARDTIHAAGRRLTIVVEMHPQCWPAFQVTEADVRDALRELGLTVRPLAEGKPLFERDGHAVLRPQTDGGPLNHVRGNRP